MACEMDKGLSLSLSLSRRALFFAFKERETLCADHHSHNLVLYMGCCCQKVAATTKTQRSKSSAESSMNHEPESSHVNNSKKRRRTRGLSVLGTSSATSIATPRRPGEEQLFTAAFMVNNESVNSAMASSGSVPVASRSNATPKAAAGAQRKTQGWPLDDTAAATMPSVPAVKEHRSGFSLHHDAARHDADESPPCDKDLNVVTTEVDEGGRGCSPGLDVPIVSPSTTEDHRLHHSVFALATSPSALLLEPPSLGVAGGVTAPEWRRGDDGDGFEDILNRNTRSTL